MKVTESMGCRRLWRGVFATAMAVGSIGLPATSAADHVYVLRDGSTVVLRKSDDELGVTFRSPHHMKLFREKSASKGRSVIDITHDEQARMKLLRSANGARLDVAQIRADDSIATAGAVYRFAGSDVPVIATGRIVLRIHDGLTKGEIERFWQDLGVVEVETISGLPGVYIVRSTNLDADDAEVAELLSNDDRADWANPDFRRVIELRQVGPQAGDVGLRPLGEPAAETAELAGQAAHGGGVVAYGFDLAPMPDDARIPHQRLEVFVVHGTHAPRLEGLENLFKYWPLGRYHAVLQAGLKDAQGHLRQITVVGHALDLPGGLGLGQHFFQRRAAARALGRLF